MKLLKIISSFAIVGVISTSCGQTKKETANTLDEASTEVMEVVQEMVETSNIVEVAAGNANFSTLVAAVKAADLVGTLSSDGPFTVFAPTNDAFTKLPSGTVEELLKPESKGTLTSILTYHVVAGKYEAGAVIDAIDRNNGTFTVFTVQGEAIDLSLNDGKVILTDAKGSTSVVVMADVAASNGVIHAIDAVVMPK